MPCHHKLERYLDAYIIAAGIAGHRRGPLFRSVMGNTAKFIERQMLRGDAWSLARRRASGAGIETAIGRHTFRATRIADYLTNGGRIEVVQSIRALERENYRPLRPAQWRHQRG